MSITPEVARIIAAVEIWEVRLVSSEARTSILAPHDPAIFQWSTNAKARPIHDGTLVVSVDCRFAISPDHDAAPTVSISGEFEVRYHLPETMEASDDVLDEFAELNGVFNVWPYWREFVQAMMLRMNLPAYTLPLYRLRRSRSEDSAVVPSPSRKSQRKGRSH